MSTTFQSINRFAVLNNVEPDSSSSKRESRGMSTSSMNTTTSMSATNKSKKMVNGSSVKGKERASPGIMSQLSNPIVADSTRTTQSNLTSTRTTSSSSSPKQPSSTTLKSRKHTSTRSHNNPAHDGGSGDDGISSTNRPAVINKRGEGLRVVSKKTDWEIPRKTLHGSIGFLVLYLHSLHPPTLSPLLLTLTLLLIIITLTDLLRTHSPQLNLIYLKIFGPLMRTSEEKGWNGVVWYLMGCIWTLGVYPRDVAVVSVLTLSWSDTAASTLGRLFSPYTSPLPPHIPFIPHLRFSPRKSLAGFLGAFFTGTLIGLFFWSHGKHQDGGYGPLWGGNRDLSVWAGEGASGWEFLSRSWGKWSTALVLGLGGAIVEALDLGYDDNLTLPILTGAIVWVWLTVVSWLTTATTSTTSTTF